MTGILFAAITLFVYIGHSEEPTWIQYSEPLAGANSPNFTDVLNRPAQTIWNNFLIEHGTDGYHNYSALASNLPIDLSSKLDVAIFENDHNPDGTHNIDMSSKLNVTVFENDHNPDGTHTFSIPSTTDDITEASNLYYTESRVSANTAVSTNTSHRTTTAGNPHNLDAADVGAVSTGTFTVEHNGDGTHNFSIPDPSEYALSGTGSGNLANGTFSPTGFFTGGAFSVWGVMTFERLGVAESFFQSISTEYSETIINCAKNSANKLTLSLGSNTYTSTLTISDLNRPTEIGCVFTGSQVYFWLDGQTDTSQAATPAFPSMNGNEQLVIGSGLQGDILYVSVSGMAIRAGASWYTPYFEGLSQCPGCELHYDMDEQSGSTLTDRLGSYDISVSGTWQEYASGY